MTCKVTGTAISPNGQIRPGARISFRRAQSDVVSQEGSFVIPDDYIIQTAINGTVNFDILPGVYDAATVAVGGHTVAFRVSVPNEPAADFADLLNASYVEIPPASVTQAQQARDAAIAARDEALLYDGPKVDLYSQIADVTSSQVPVDGYLRVIDRMLTLKRAPDAATDHQLTGAGAVKFYLIGPWSSSAFASSAAFIDAVAAYAPTLVANKTLLTVKAGESVAIPCNPTDHDFQAYANYAASGHTVANTGELYLSVADGLHNVTTYVDIVDRKFLDIRASATPDQIAISSATFTNLNEAQATGTASVTDGAVTGVAVDTGGKYFAMQPTVTFSGGGGTGAAATAVLTDGVVTSVTVTNGGSGYTSAPTVVIKAPPAGEVYSANIVLETALPARVVAGWCVWGQNVQGDGGADALNGAMEVLTIASDRLSFTANIRSHGVALTNFTTPDNTASLGLTPNRLVIPYSTIRADEAGWDGAAREAFINTLRGGRVRVLYLGFTYNGLAGDNDMFFAQGAGSEIRFSDLCGIAGAGEMCVRTNDHGHIYANRSAISGGVMGVNVWQGSGGGSVNFVRTMMGSVSGDALSTSSGASADLGLSVVTGANIGLRTTYANSTIVATGTRVSRCNLAVAPANGQITVDSNSSLKNSTTPISITGSNGGTVKGDPTIADNTNAVVTSFAIQTSGGVWIPKAGKTYDPVNRTIGRFTGSLNFPSIAAHTYEDLTIAADGAAFNDFVHFARSGSAEPAQGIVFRAFVSAADTVTVRAYNITTSAIDPTAFTARVLVIRSA